MTSRSAIGGIVSALVVVCSVGILAADPPGSSSTQSTTNESTIEWSGFSVSERTRAEVWDLTANELRRYRSLMEGIRGSISPDTISPIEVLGIHARDEAERRRYAEQWVLKMREDAERVLAFQHAYDEASRLLFPDETLIDLARLPKRRSDDRSLIKTDRVLVFVRPDCIVCDALLPRLLARLDRVAGIDFYLSGIEAGNETAIREWATAQGVAAEWVKAGRVTLNFEAGALQKLAPGTVELPVVMRRRGETISPLPGSAL